ncbi:hypothetical protein [Streptomyces sp. 058-1L]|uniref:hypothetical protein n=1 Tax=Streptomyces sp. 058-1L TaxID=2789266 RepID=UPI00397FCBFC
MTRTDLLVLTAEVLAALTNRGLVKRAARELAAGGGATVALTPDRTLAGRLPDGTECGLPPGAGLDQRSCTCAATGVFRHLIGLILAYQETATAPVSPAPPAPAIPWSPGHAIDEELTAAVGAKAVAAARHIRHRGYPARLAHPRRSGDEARCQLPTTNVRFTVPGALGYAVSDVHDQQRGAAVALVGATYTGCSSSTAR